jgi:hypothetical protein
MAYYSTFKLETVPNLEYTAIFHDVVKAFQNLPYFSSSRDYELFERFVSGSCSMSDISWYDCAEHLQDISRQFPGIAFAIHRIGEAYGEDAEIEGIYAKDGELERILRKPDFSRPQSEKFKDFFPQP